ncbi:MAG: formyltetrahydrofolate deformylase [Deltaproteobacteria bacterium]|nr:formyltetrahydrofolate deformylase [Deltaproteobacteria bacterium]
MPRPHAVLKVIGADRAGLVADVANLLFRLGANILHADDHIDFEAGLFFQRVEFTLQGELTSGDRERIGAQIGQTCDQWKMRWDLRWHGTPRRVALLTSKHPHCTLDLLARHRAGELACELPVVISNHPDLEHEVTRRGYKYVHEPIAGGDKRDQEQRIQKQLEAEKIDLVVLARYMQILSSDFVAPWRERILNIHHSFLPAFAGAEPYKQAYRRGVKLIGATSHYVTADLDEGPIVWQDVTRVSHRDSVDDLVRKGRDLERVVLANAVRCALEDRIIAYGNKTVVFD